MEEWEKLRNSTLFDIGNMLHDDVPVSNDEVGGDSHYITFGFHFSPVMCRIYTYLLYSHSPDISWWNACPSSISFFRPLYLQHLFYYVSTLSFFTSLIAVSPPPNLFPISLFHVSDQLLFVSPSYSNMPSHLCFSHRPTACTIRTTHTLS